MMACMQEIQLLGDEGLGSNEITLLGPDDFGFSFNPIRHIRRAAGGVAHVAKKVGGGAISVGKKVGGTALKVAVLPAYYVTKYAADLALRPVRSRINTLVGRRAAKIAWDRRRSKQPTGAEHNEARNWAKARFKSQGPHGHLLALLAGPTLQGQLGDFGVAPAVVAAAVPILVSIATGMIKKYAGTGEAPEDPAAAAAAAAQQVVQQAMPAAVQQYIPQPAQQIDVAPSQPAAELPAPEPVPVDPVPAATEGYFGAPPPDTTAAIVLGLLGAAAAGTGAYLAFRRR